MCYLSSFFIYKDINLLTDLVLEINSITDLFLNS
jgi:hypothetical protein